MDPLYINTLAFFISVLLAVFVILIVFTIRGLISKAAIKREAEEIKDAIDSTFEENKVSENVLDLMVKNVAELRGYYVLSKQQANKSFASALLICFLGFFVFILGIFINYFSDQNIIIFTTIAGSVVEIISGLFFWLYKNTLSQLNIYHERLGTSEKYLTAIQLIDKMSQEKRDDAYKFLIESMLANYSSVLENKKDDE